MALDVLVVDGGVHANLAVGHAHGVRSCRVALLHFFLVYVLSLQHGASLLTVLVGENGIDWGLGSIALTVSELFSWQHHGLVSNEAEGNSSVVRGSEFVLVTGVNRARLEGHLVQLLEVTGVMMSLLRALVKLPLLGDILGGFTVGKQLWLSVDEGVLWESTSSWLRFANVVLHKETVGLLAKQHLFTCFL